jgi:hypothetical protein
MIRPYRFTLLAVSALAGWAAQVDEAARRQYDELVTRQHLGGRVTTEERELMMKVYSQMNPPRDHTGMVAITDLGKGSYKGEQGGLYPGGENSLPPAHLKAGLEQARQIVPLDAGGRPSPDGKIALMSIGMSNTTMEYQTFMKMAAEEKEINPRLALVDGAQNGQSSLETSDPRAPFWQVVDQRMSAAGVTAQQVQAVWMFQVVVTPNRPFPLDVRRLQSLMVDTLRVAHARFPNLKIAYLSSRTYAGYARVPQNPEPHSYESGFALKWIIADQIAGYLEFNYDPARGRLRFPWVAWGPCLWADGVKGRKDGVAWAREDFGNDGMHPSMQGREKIARMLMRFLKTDPTAAPWFLAKGQAGPNARQMEERRRRYIQEHPPQSSMGLIPLTLNPAV